jgi:acetyl esterase
MNHPALRFAALLAFAPVASVFAAQAYPPSFDGARAEVYKTVGETKLSLWIFEPVAGPKTNRPAIVFFFGGGWTSGTPGQFEQHCRYLATRGIVAITADYRVASRHSAKPTQCVADAKSAVRWLRANAARLGLDPDRIAAGGGSAGGHLAAATATLPDFDEPTEDKAVGSVPNALVLFNPALVLAPMEGLALEGFGTRVPAERLGAAPEKLSPAHHVKKGAPPTIIFHGKADTTVPYATAEKFEHVMKAAGNRCELVGFDGEGHGFFNLGRGDNTAYHATLVATDRFLASLGWVKGDPTLERPAASAAKEKRKAAK